LTTNKLFCTTCNIVCCIFFSAPGETLPNFVVCDYNYHKDSILFYYIEQYKYLWGLQDTT